MLLVTCGFDSHPRYKYNIMKKIDLHNKTHDESRLIVNLFIENNIDNLPLKIVIGNSYKMKSIVEEVVKKFNVKCDYQNHHNLGSLVITEKY